MTFRQSFSETISGSPYLFTIGVAGDSGSGKTTFTTATREIFGSSLVSTITLDDYHIYNREQRRGLGITPLSPEANDLDRLERDLGSMKAGNGIEKMVYNHRSGTIEGPVPFRPGKILILEGLHAFSTPALRALLDFTLYVDPEETVKHEWKTRRDTEARGYTKLEVEHEREQRRKDYERFVKPQRRYADAVVEIAPSVFRPDVFESPGNVYRVTLIQGRSEIGLGDTGLRIGLAPLLGLADRDFLLEFRRLVKDGRPAGALTLDGEMMYGMVRRLEESIEEQTGVRPIRLFEGRNAVTAGEVIQLVLAWRIINRRICIAQECGCSDDRPADPGRR